MQSRNNHNKRIRTSKNNSLEYVLKARLNDAKQRSRKHNIYFELTYEECYICGISRKDLCALSGIPMTHNILCRQNSN